MAPRFQAKTEELRAAGGRQQGLGDRLLEACGRLEGAGSSAAEACGDPALGQAFEDLGRSWAGSRSGLGGAVAGLATNVQAAAGAYEETDAGAMPRR